MASPAQPDRNRSLDELEGAPRDATAFDSHLVQSCHALRTKPLQDFSPEDFRIMIGQNIGLPFLLPLALNILKDDPLAAGEYYESELLVAALRSEVKQSGEWRVVVYDRESAARHAFQSPARAKQRKRGRDSSGYQFRSCAHAGAAE